MMELTIREPVYEERQANGIRTEAEFRFLLVAANFNGVKLRKVATPRLGLGVFDQNPC
jgi:hypothetical protein